MNIILIVIIATKPRPFRNFDRKEPPLFNKEKSQETWYAWFLVSMPTAS